MLSNNGTQCSEECLCAREKQVSFLVFFQFSFALKTANESRPLEVVRPAVTRHRRSWTERDFLDFGKEEVRCINTIMLSWIEAFKTRLKKEPATRIFNQHYHIIFQTFSIYSIKEAKCAKATSTFWRNVRKNVVGCAWFKKNLTILAVSHYQDEDLDEASHHVNSIRPNETIGGKKAFQSNFFGSNASWKDAS